MMKQLCEICEIRCESEVVTDDERESHPVESHLPHLHLGDFAPNQDAGPYQCHLGGVQGGRGLATRALAPHGGAEGAASRASGAPRVRAKAHLELFGRRSANVAPFRGSCEARPRRKRI